MKVMAAAPRRALILAGGGLKVAFQAGVLQVWLDEAKVNGRRLEFQHADGASGGVFNLAMYCQGLSGTEIADRWRGFRPLDGIQLNWPQYPRLLGAASLLRYGRFRRNVLDRWLDWEEIRNSERSATFNVYNFSKHELEVRSPARMSPELLTAAVSLPVWFPPVEVEGETYIDAVFATDANLLDAIQRHDADELWIIWTVDPSGRWHDGLVASYFHMIEACAVTALKRDLERIERNNRLGRRGEFGRYIKVRQLQAQVPVQYLTELHARHFREAVELGVRQARAWCRDQGDIELIDTPDPSRRGPGGRRPTSLRFRERMRGHLAFDVADPRRGEAVGRQRHDTLTARLRIRIDDIDRFVKDPAHQASAEGIIDCDVLGGELPIRRGRFNLLVEEGDPRRTRMDYCLEFKDGAGHLLELQGNKLVHDDPGFDVWSDTTTLFFWIRSVEDHREHAVAAGILRISLPDVLATTLSFNPSPWYRLVAVTRYAKLFFGRLRRVYLGGARHTLSLSERRRTPPPASSPLPGQAPGPAKRRRVAS